MHLRINMSIYIYMCLYRHFFSFIVKRKKIYIHIIKKINKRTMQQTIRIFCVYD